MNRSWRHLIALAWLAIIVCFGIYDGKALHLNGKVQFDLLALLPQGKAENMRLSNQLMEDGNVSGRIVIAFGHEDSVQSKRALQLFRDQLKASHLPLIEHNVKSIESDYKTLFTVLYPYRAALMSKEDRQSLHNVHSDIVFKSAISNIMSPFSAFSASQIQTDPFGFYPRYVSSFAFNDTLQTDADGDLALNADGKIWHIYQGEVTEKIFSLKLQEKISESLLPILSRVENTTGAEILRVGAAFYSSAGAQKAQNEIATIGFFSTLGIILVLLLTFGVPHPILLAITVVTSGLVVGLAACFYAFGSIHILALVFGCSLVGVAVDYALHYYCASFKPIDRFKILSLLLPAMPLGVLTSSIGYGALIAAPFPGIQQMAVLACVGLLCTFISVAVWGPYFIKSGERQVPALAEKIQHRMERLSTLGSIKYLKPIMSTFLLLLFCVGASILTFDDNVRNFQSMDTQLKGQEERLKTMMNFHNSTKFLAVTNYDLERILQAEETITQDLDKNGIGYRALSDLLPSQQRQQENTLLKLNYSLAKFPEIAAMLVLDQSFNAAEAGFDENPLIADNQFLKSLPTGWKELVHVADDGLITGRIMINGVANEDLLAHYPDSTYIDPVIEYSSLFASYRQVMLILVAGLLLVFTFIISLRQGLWAAITITTPVVLSMLVTIGIIGLFGIGFSMFHAMGLILVLCIGIDYGVFLYWRKRDEKELLLLGNSLAALTTILSFGLLTLSATTAVHSFGLTVLIGIILNFFITTLFLGNYSGNIK